MKTNFNLDNTQNLKGLAQKPTRSFSAKDKEKLKTASMDFQSLMIGQMLKTMRETQLKDEEQGETLGADMYTELFDMELAKSISRNGKFGVAEIIYKKLTGEEFSVEKKETPKSRGVDLIHEKIINETKSKENIQSNNNTLSKVNNSAINNVISRVSRFENIIQKASNKHSIDSNLIKAVIAAESGGIETAYSKADAKGLMQLIDSTAKDMGVTNSLNPAQNINGGAKYLREMLNKFDGNLNLALAAYNAGPGAVEKYNGVPPFKETKNYIVEVKKYLNLFRNSDKKEIALNE